MENKPIYDEKLLDGEVIKIPRWNTVEECAEEDHLIEVVQDMRNNESRNYWEWICTKCGYLEWGMPDSGPSEKNEKPR